MQNNYTSICSGKSVSKNVAENLGLLVAKTVKEFEVLTAK